jgi:uncharacterized damage-inducible protein DinB
VTDLRDFYPQTRADERTTLEQFLDYYRRVVVTKIEDLDEERASCRALPATDLTVGGIVKHLAGVEDLWFRRKLLGLPPLEPFASAPSDVRDWDFHSSAHDSVAGLCELYERACDRSRAAAALFDSLDASAAVSSFGRGPVTLRWVFVHMIEETARHAGHLDLLRDGIDGIGVVGPRR